MTGEVWPTSVVRDCLSKIVGLNFGTEKQNVVARLHCHLFAVSTGPQQVGAQQVTQFPS